MAEDDEVPSWDAQALLYLPIMYSSATLSVFGELSIMAYYAFVPSERSFFMKLMTYMAFFQMGGSAAWFLNTPSPMPSICVAGAILSTFFYVSTFMWSSCIAFAMLLSIRKSEENSRIYEMTFLMICIIFPAICCIIPVALGMYSNEVMPFEVGCWFLDEYSWARIIFFDLWILVSWLFNLVILFLIQREFKTMRAFTKLTPSFAEAARDQRRLFTTLLCSFMICWFWSLLLAILAVMRDWGNVTMSPADTFPLVIIFALFAPAQAFLNFLALLVQSRTFRENYIDLWRRFCCLRPRMTSSMAHSESDPFLSVYTPFHGDNETYEPLEREATIKIPRPSTQPVRASPRISSIYSKPLVTDKSSPAYSTSFEANINGDGGIVPSAVVPRVVRTSSAASSSAQSVSANGRRLTFG